MNKYPELSGNIIIDKEEDNRLSSFYYDVKDGNYKVVGECIYDLLEYPDNSWIFTGRRQLLGAYTGMKGKYSFEGMVHVGRYIPRGASRAYKEKLSVNVISQFLSVRNISIEKIVSPTIHIAGDSTVTDQPSGLPYNPLECYSGWGQMLPFFLGNGFAVANHAHSGLSTESFRKEGHYKIMLDELNRGDYVLIQFAHNDQKIPHLGAKDGYYDNINRYIDELTDRGVNPILVTPLARNTWCKNIYNDLLEIHADTVREIGQERDVPVIDLHRETVKKIKEYGYDKAAIYYHEGDLTHTNDLGAFKAAKIVAGELIERLENRGDRYSKLFSAIRRDRIDNSETEKVLNEYVVKRNDETEKTDSSLINEHDEDIVPADLTGPSSWRIDDRGIIIQ